MRSDHQFDKARSSVSASCSALSLAKGSGGLIFSTLPRGPQDEISTPYCITVDFDTLEDDAVTVRERDSMKQERIAISQVEAYLGAQLPGC